MARDPYVAAASTSHERACVHLDTGCTATHGVFVHVDAASTARHGVFVQLDAGSTCYGRRLHACRDRGCWLWPQATACHCHGWRARREVTGVSGRAVLAHGATTCEHSPRVRVHPRVTCTDARRPRADAATTCMSAPAPPLARRNNIQVARLRAGSPGADMHVSPLLVSSRAADLCCDAVSYLGAV